MSRVFRENNAQQAVREVVVNGVAVPITCVVVAFAHRFSTNENAKSYFFFVPLSIAGGLIGRELVWLFRYALHTLRWKGILESRSHEPRTAHRRDYIKNSIAFVLVFLGIACPLAVNMIAELFGKYNFGSVYAWIDPFAHGGIIAFLTGDLLGAGIIAGLERWGTVNEEDFSQAPNLILLIVGVITALLCEMHAIRTILALCGRDQSYRKFLLAERFGWDADSQALYAQGHEDIITASSNHSRPYVQYFLCSKCNDCDDNTV